MPDNSMSTDRLSRLPFCIVSGILGVAAGLATQLLWPHFLLVVVMFYVILYWIGFCSKRLHDLDLSGWAFLWAFVPLANIVFFLYLTFAKGTTGPNRFGGEPVL